MEPQQTAGEAAQAASTKRLPQLADLPLGGRTLLLRLDLNVPRDGAGNIESQARLTAAVPTIQAAAKAGAKVILCSHLGQPGGRREAADSLLPVIEALCGLLDQDIVFCPEAFGAAPRSLLAQLRAGQVMALENLRFWPGEEANEASFARSLAALADCYLNDAFGTLHRAHASIVGVPAAMPHVAVGPLIGHEMAALSKLMEAPREGFVAIIGGAKVAAKVGLLRALVGRAEHLAIGGLMAMPFLVASGHSVGGAEVSTQALLQAQSVVHRAKESGCKLWLPQDHVVVRDLSPTASAEPCDAPQIPPGLLPIDIGPKSAAAFAQLAAQAQAVFWNGPLGIASWPTGAAGSLAVAQGIAACQGLSVVGGGDSLAVLERRGLVARVSHASTGGGATLALLEHGTLPGLAAIARHGR